MTSPQEVCQEANPRATSYVQSDDRFRKGGDCCLGAQSLPTFVRGSFSGDGRAAAHLRGALPRAGQGQPRQQPRHGDVSACGRCCAGVIAWHEELAGGRYNIVVRGVARARISEELPARKQYREVQAEILGDAAFSGPEDEQLRQTVFELAGLLPHSFGQTVLQSAASTSGGSLADAMAAALVIDLGRRQQLLSELDVRRRLLGVVDEVGELIARLTPPKDTGPVN